MISQEELDRRKKVIKNHLVLNELPSWQHVCSSGVFIVYLGQHTTLFWRPNDYKPKFKGHKDVVIHKMESGVMIPIDIVCIEGEVSYYFDEAQDSLFDVSVAFKHLYPIDESQTSELVARLFIQAYDDEANEQVARINRRNQLAVIAEELKPDTV